MPGLAICSLPLVLSGSPSLRTCIRLPVEAIQEIAAEAHSLQTLARNHPIRPMFYRPPPPTLDEQLKGCRPIPDAPVAEPQRGGIFLLFRLLQRLSRSHEIATYPGPVNLPYEHP